jgi:hypothetical protein
MENPPEMIEPEKAHKFEPAEFVRIMDAASNSARRMPSRTTQEMREAHCDDSTMMNFGVAAAAHFPNDKDKSDSFILRWRAMGIFLHSGELSERYFVSPDRWQKIVAEVFAAVPLTHNMSPEPVSLMLLLDEKLRD